jgi:chemotaxis protein MotB
MALFIVLWLLSSSQEVQKVVGGYFSDPAGDGKMVGSTKSGSGDALTLRREEIQRIKQIVSQAVAALPQLNNLKQQVAITVTSEGLRIELLESVRGLFFELGSPVPTEDGKQVLAAIGKELSSLPNPLLIEGHTDAKPYGKTASYTNWELSSDRANAARRVLLDAGYPVRQISQVRGFADQKLHDVRDPENASNRRISIIVGFVTAEPPGHSARIAAP